MSTEEERYEVFFEASGSPLREMPPGTIVISPKETTWNNFGFMVEISIGVRSFTKGGDVRPYLEGSAMLGVLDDRDPKGGDVRTWMDAAPGSSGRISVNELPPFFTMQVGMGEYRNLVRVLSVEEAKKVLTALNDVVAAEEFGEGAHWLKRAMSTRVFQLAFVRTSEAYYAWKNAAPVLRGLEFEEIHRASDTLKIEFQLDGRPGPHLLDFKFETGDEVLPKRFAVMIGKNGVGKSQALAHIVSAAVSRGKGLRDAHGERARINRLLAFSSSSAAASAFPGDRRKRPQTWYKRFLLNSPGSGRNRQTSSDLIEQLARSKEYLAGSKRYDLFIGALRAIEGWQSLAVRMRKGNGRPVLLDALLDGGERELLNRFAAIDKRAEVVRCVGRKTYPLSSGELSFLRFAAQAGLYIENGSLLLFDEPETHLHPNFISRFVAILDSLLETTGSIAIIATHSAYFVREAFEDQVLVLRTLPDGTPDAQQPTLKTFGANVGAISYFVFGEDEPSRLARDVERKIFAQSGSWEEVFEKYKDELSLEVLGDIRAAIEGSGPVGAADE